MSCEHCCMSCGVNYKGEHMSKETYQNALKLIADYGDYAVLSGGNQRYIHSSKSFCSWQLRMNNCVQEAV